MTRAVSDAGQDYDVFSMKVNEALHNMGRGDMGISFTGRPHIVGSRKTKKTFLYTGEDLESATEGFYDFLRANVRVDAVKRVLTLELR